MLEYFEMAANHLINAPVEPPPGRATIPVEPSS
jgi:hypothetical protein